jgi:hypothetical protein
MGAGCQKKQGGQMVWELLVLMHVMTRVGLVSVSWDVVWLEGGGFFEW